MPDDVIENPKPEWRWSCPKCKAKIGKPCTYLKDLQVWEHNRVAPGGTFTTRQVVKHREGEMCVRSHNERLVLRFAIKKRKAARVFGPSPAVRALWDYDKQEYYTMRTWLRENSSIFLAEAVDMLPDSR